LSVLFSSIYQGKTRTYEGFLACKYWTSVEVADSDKRIRQRPQAQGQGCNTVVDPSTHHPKVKGSITANGGREKMSKNITMTMKGFVV